MDRSPCGGDVGTGIGKGVSFHDSPARKWRARMSRDPLGKRNIESGSRPPSDIYSETLGKRAKQRIGTPSPGAYNTMVAHSRLTD